MSQRSIKSFFKNKSDLSKNGATDNNEIGLINDSPIKSRRKKKLVVSSESENEENVLNSDRSELSAVVDKQIETKISKFGGFAEKRRTNLSQFTVAESDTDSKEEKQHETIPASKRFLNSAKAIRTKKRKVERSKTSQEEETNNTKHQQEIKSDTEDSIESSSRTSHEKLKNKDSDSKESAEDDVDDVDASSSSKTDDFGKSIRKSTQFYDPVNGAVWTKGSPTPYAALSETLAAIEETSGRLRIVEILSNFFRSVMILSPSDLLPSVYLCLNRLAPAYEGLELGVGEHILMKAIAKTTGRSVAQLKRDTDVKGDLGIVAESSRSTQRLMFKPASLTVSRIYKCLREIATMTGNACGNKKIDQIQSLLVACQGFEARFLIRSLAGKLRVGLAEQSVLQALAHASVASPLVDDKQRSVQRYNFGESVSKTDKFKLLLDEEAFLLKTAYCECPCYDLILPILLNDGVIGVSKKCKLSLGIPTKPMLAHPTKGIQEVLNRFEDAKFTCEWKYDGERAQIHLHEDGTINIYSRNQENNTSKYPDIIERFSKCKGDEFVKSVILDTEVVAWDREKEQIQPFQILSTRKRKDASNDEISVQVAVFAFDILYLNGRSLVRLPFRERRQILRDNFRTVQGEFYFAKSADPESMEQIQEVLEESVKENCEGLMVKTLDVDATYEISKRSRNWLKLKKDYLDGVGDTLDVVVIGGYLGRGKRVGTYGGFLLACYDIENEEYQTVCKIGTGFSDIALSSHYNFFKDHVIKEAKSYYLYDSAIAPDHWFDPVQVWEIKVADLSLSPVHRAGVGLVHPQRGISLRFPRFIRIRDDKKPEDATTAEQVATFYKNQEQIKNQKKDASSLKQDDDFDF